MLFRLAVGISAIVILRALSDLRQPKCVPKYGCRNRNIIVTGANSGIGYQTGKMKNNYCELKSFIITSFF